MRHRSLGLAWVALGCLGIALLLGCESIQSPDTDLGQAPDAAAGLNATAPRSSVIGLPATPAQPPRPGKPFKGKIKTLAPVWFVSHFAEADVCGSLAAGTLSDVGGNFTHMGKTTGYASAAWDWSIPAAGMFTPAGPATGTSATILDTYPYDFCSSDEDATGEVVLARKNGDELHGVVVGGEVYELGFVMNGDGQEQFIAVEITGGTGRFANASGGFVFHAIVNLVSQTLVEGEVLDGGRISY